MKTTKKTSSPVTESHMFVVTSVHYENWERDESGEIETFDEETGFPQDLGVYTTLDQAVSAISSFVDSFEPDEDGNGPLENMFIQIVPVNRPPTVENFLAEIGVVSDKTKIHTIIDDKLALRAAALAAAKLQTG